MPSRDAVLCFELIARLRAAVNVPLVLHGSPGVADNDLAKAVASGITMVNISTDLNKIFTRTVRERLGASPEVGDPRKYLGPARAAVQAEVARLLGVLAGS
ncbi:class II fructose-bisphosphate aldolase [Streptomyces colonosanans]|uniref:Fructose-bisphosphate aldolase n=1 Tax=Streptomyces colonosanans TaxID=1428652 RepID=A0A1S2PHS5_9ACTN|nr:hypothetical protein BIV24_12045 [Streptomyces colonosanans]